VLGRLRGHPLVKLVSQGAQQNMPGVLRQGDAARVGTQQPAGGGARRSSPTSVTAEIAAIGNTLESWQDLEAEVKTVVKVLGCR
jgi:hypothetical protein